MPLKHYKIYIDILANLKTFVLDSLMHLSKDKCKHMETLVFRFVKDLEMKQILSFQGLLYPIGMAVLHAVVHTFHIMYFRH